MNTIEQNPDVDKMLSTFFKAEMPVVFPSLKLPSMGARIDMPMPAVSRSAHRDGQTISKSRLSLAVSVALLIGGCWYLSDQMGNAPERSKATKVSGDGATMPPKIRKAIEEPKKASNMP